MRAWFTFLLLTSCTDNPPSAPPSVEQRVWEYGPSCINDTGSCGVPAGPSMHGEGFVIDVPPEPHHVNYVSFRHGTLVGKSLIRMRFRVEGGPIRATKPRGEIWDGKLTLYFARAGNDFTGGPAQNWYRWWAVESETRLHEGEYEITARFDEHWAAVSYGANHCTDDGNDPDCRGPAMFQAALANADRVGFTLGGGDGRGHGVHGEGQIIVTEFAVE